MRLTRAEVVSAAGAIAMAVTLFSILAFAAPRQREHPPSAGEILQQERDLKEMEQKRPPSMVAPEAVPSSKWDERMIELDLEAVDEAYRDTISKLFAVWMRDPTGQPTRAIVGAQAARRAYILVRQALEKREAERIEREGK